MVSARSFEFAAGSWQVQPPVQVVFADLPGGGGDRPQRSQHAPGHQPAQGDRDRRHDAERDDQLHLVRVRLGGGPEEPGAAAVRVTAHVR